MHPQVEALLNSKTFGQRTPEWYFERTKRLTSSDISATMMCDKDACEYYVELFNPPGFAYKPRRGCHPYKSVRKYVKEKAAIKQSRTSGVNDNTLWGVKFEQVAVNLYSQLTGRQVMEFGLVGHPEHDWMGTSPDGITSCGRMLEIKVPSQRPITKIPPLMYFHQMLHQMECCNLDYVDFLDVHIVEWMFEDEWEAAARQWERDHPGSKHHSFGIVLDHAGDPFATQPTSYPPVSVRTCDSFLQWAREREGDPFYYQIVGFELTEVPRSRDWYHRNVGRWRKVWEDVLETRAKLASGELKEDEEDSADDAVDDEPEIFA